jgi:hypothetical protein
MARIAALAPVSFRPLSRPQHGVFEFVPRGRFRRQPLKGADIPTQGRGTNVMQVLSFSGKLSEATHYVALPGVMSFREIFHVSCC